MKQKIENVLISAVLIWVLTATLGLIAYVIAGPFLVFIILAGIGVLYLFSPNIAPKLMMGLFKVRPLSFYDAPHVHRMVNILSRRADLEKMPEIYLIPSDTLAAFATGTRNKSAVAISAGIINRLSDAEIAGITAHEISHIKNNDMRSMWFALLLGRLTESLSLWGQVILLISLPFIIINGIYVNVMLIAVLIIAPFFSYLVQLTMSRNNEFNADLGSAELLGSPEPLISALSKIDYDTKGVKGFFFPTKTSNDVSVLFRTHPPTEERIRRLSDIRAVNPYMSKGKGGHVYL